jgi:heptosyltransferase II
VALDPQALEDAATRMIPVPTPSRILLRAPNWLGDVMLSLGSVRDLRRSFPAARVEVMARPAVAQIYEAVAGINGIRLPGELRRGEFDAALLFTNSFHTAFDAFRARIPERWGYATDGRGLLLTRRVRPQRRALHGESERFYYRALLAGLGLEVSAAQDLSLSCPPAWRARALEALGDDGPWIALNPGAAYGSAKRWLPERFAALGSLVAQACGARIAILGGASERACAEEIACAMRAPVRVLAGETSLAELVGVLATTRLLVTNDSGPMHVAAALGTPLVALFGPTDWRETAPQGERCRVVREPVACAPCKLRTCPIDHRCMTRIEVERVQREVELLWRAGEPRGEG